MGGHETTSVPNSSQGAEQTMSIHSVRGGHRASAREEEAHEGGQGLLVNQARLCALHHYAELS